MPSWKYSVEGLDKAKTAMASGRDLRISPKATREICSSIRKMRLEDAKKFLEEVKGILADRVTEVRESKRLKSSPSCLVNSEAGMTSQMQKMMNMMNKDMTIPKLVFEINKDSSLVRNLLKIYKNDPKDQFITTSIEQLYESDLLMEGYLTDPHKLVNRVKEVLAQNSTLMLKK